ncbi:hypothetical protein M2337_000980 [Sphingobium sp. B2D3A]|uniref:putative Ig domain-containing protein n=1 Tax=unclassified Sphingobium TaxID=2611147 RepID=UPI0022259238|nr:MULTISPECIES: putative Ig domain-containing protein [unclassified Sphingobium]MCW2336747.1 hypothetical protein [Sphingobium sp. B2D3A]MCW2386501.1 hypothetical protein [Sphingobium sp. B2D3D]
MTNKSETQAQMQAEMPAQMQAELPANAAVPAEQAQALAQAAPAQAAPAPSAQAAAGHAPVAPAASHATLAAHSATLKKVKARTHKKDDEDDAAQNGDQKDADAAQADADQPESAVQASAAGGQGHVGEGQWADRVYAQGAAGAGAGGGSGSFFSTPAFYVLGAAGAIGAGFAIFGGGSDEASIAAPKLALKTDTGASATDFITQDGTIDVTAITGTNAWEYSTNGGSTWTAGTGTSFTLAEGSYAAGAVQVRQKDATSGKTSEAGKIANAITVDKTAAAAPVINAVAGDDLVNQAETQAPVSVSGTAEAGTSITVTWGTTTKTVTTGTDGTWTATFAAADLPADGSTTITAKATDAAGNISATGSRPVTIDSSNYITGTVAAGPVIAGIEIKAYKADGTLLGSVVTDASGAFRVAFKGYTGLVLVAATDPTTNAQGYLNEATGTQADIDVMLRAVATVTAGQDVVINISPFTEVATRLMSSGLATSGATNLANLSADVAAKANATVGTLFTDNVDTPLTAQLMKLVIDSTGANTAANANVYGVYLAALQGWAHSEGLTLDQAIQQIVDAITTTANGANTTLADLGQAQGQLLADILIQGFHDVTQVNPALANASLPQAQLQQLGMINDTTGPAFSGGSTVSVSVLETAAPGTLLYTATASDPSGKTSYSIAWGSGPAPFAAYDIADFFTIDPQTGVIKTVQALDYEDRSSWSIEVTATDFWGNQSVQAVTVNVGNVNEAPVLDNPLADQVATANQPFSYIIPSDAFYDVDGDTLTYAAQLVDAQGNVSALPSWLTFNAQTGTLSSTAVQALTDPITIRVTASDGSLTATDDFTLSIASAPVVTEIVANKAVAMGASTVTFTVTLSEGVTYPSSPVPEVVLRFIATNTYLATATLDGAATAALNDPTKLVFTAQVPVTDTTEVRILALNFTDVTGLVSGEPVSSDSGQLVTYGALPFVVDSTAPALTSATLTVNENATAVGTLSASEAVSWALAPGGDAGLFTLSSSGALSFTAPRDYETQAHSYTINVNMTDLAGNMTSQAVTVNLANVNEAPVVAHPLADQATVQGQAFSYTVPSNSFSDVDAGTTLTYTAQLVGSGGALSALPSWLTFNAATHTFSSTSAPALASPITVRVTASDGSLSVSDDFTVSQASVPVFSTNLNGVTNLDVRSDVVFSASENIALTTVDGTYTIKLVNDANSGSKTGYSGTLGESIDNTQTLVVTVSGGVASAKWNGVTVNVNDVLSVSGNKLIIDSVYDLDFSNNYHVEVGAGLFIGQTSGLGNAAVASGATFATVTPNTTGSGAALVSGGAASQIMHADGTLAASHKWVGIDNVGNTAVASATSIGSLSAAGYALVVSDRDASADIGTWDFWVRATDFGADDLVYLDNQQNGTVGWDLSTTSFASGDSPNDNDTRVGFGTYNVTAPFPNSSQSYIDLDIGGEWRETPDAVQTYFQSATPLFVGG